MLSKTILPAIPITLLSSLAIGSAGFAQDAPPTHAPNQSQDVMGGANQQPTQGRGMMMGGNMPEMMNMMRQMTRMMENCNRMMEGADQNPSAPEKPPATETPRG